MIKNSSTRSFQLHNLNQIGKLATGYTVGYKRSSLSRFLGRLGYTSNVADRGKMT
jgi:hypothetical protein